MLLGGGAAASLGGREQWVGVDGGGGWVAAIDITPR